MEENFLKSLDWAIPQDKKKSSIRASFDRARAHYTSLEGCKGLICERDVIALFVFASLSPGNLLELGAYQGMSSCILSQAAFETGRILDTVDLNFPPAFFQQLAEFGRPDNVCYHQSRSEHFLEQLPQASIGFCFHDTSHTYEQTKLELKLLVPRLQERAILMIHDYMHPNYDGLKRAVDETFYIQDDMADGYNMVNLGTFIALQKQMDNNEKG